MYELFEKASSTGQLFLIRVAQNRLTTDNKKIIDEIKSRRPQGFMKVSVPRNSRTNTKARETILEASYRNFELKKPKALECSRGLQEAVAVNVIYVREKSDDLSIEPIEWILATNDPVNSIDDAREKIENYVQRWKIERFHYVLKSGCTVEKIQEREVSKIVALLLMYSIISFFIMNLTYIARINPDISCSILFDEDEWKVLYCAGNRTKIPPNEPYSIKEAVTYLGHLGAPKRAPSDGPPGLKTIWIGLSNLHLLLSYREILCV
ncbi:hypothetical protein FACS1894126_3300 [Alphaproteobacteria bacterium]|nr:hypothetical protein FACS1894126_3300 [Alphaproteobacteria bacterium]